MEFLQRFSGQHILFYDTDGTPVTQSRLLDLMTTIPPSSDPVQVLVMEQKVRSLAAFFQALDSGTPCVLCSAADETQVADTLMQTGTHVIEGKPLLGFLSSATSGRPQMVWHDTATFLKRYTHSERPIKALCFYAADHIAFVDVMLSTLACNGVLYLQNALNAISAWKFIQSNQINTLFAGPSFLQMLAMQAPEPVPDSSLKKIIYGSERMPLATLETLKRIFPVVQLKNVFATTQALRPRMQTDPEDETFYKMGEHGLDHKIEEDVLFLKKPESLQYILDGNQWIVPTDFLNTGDLVEVNERGYYRITARTSRSIHVGGEKVSPEKITDLLTSIPGVLDAHVYGEANALLGEMVCADIVKVITVDEDTMKQCIREICRTRLRPAEMPVKITFVPEIRVSARGKR